MYLDELFDYKNELMKVLCQNEKIVRLITDSEDAPVPDYDLPYNQIYPFEFVPETVSEGTTFICFDVDIADVLNKTFYLPVLYVWIFTHKSKLRLEEGGIRLDQLSVEVNKELNGNRKFGLGELELRRVDRFVPVLDYRGRVLTYTARDFNRIAPSKKPPANRKNRG